MMYYDMFILLFLILTFDIVTAVIIVAYCTHLINKKLGMLVSEDRKEAKQPKKKHKSPANKTKTEESKRKNIFDALFGIDDIYDFDEDEDEILSSDKSKKKSRRFEEDTYEDINEDVSDDELYSWVSEKELDDIATSTFNPKQQKQKKAPTSKIAPMPLRTEKVIPFEQPRMYYFTNPQDLVNYIANRQARTVYDTKKNRIQKIKSFDVDYSGGLMIYYDYYDLPDYFEPGRFAKVS